MGNIVAPDAIDASDRKSFVTANDRQARLLRCRHGKGGFWLHLGNPESLIRLRTICMLMRLSIKICIFLKKRKKYEY
jgi:hypothetical protein